ncbi:fibronectin type III domain-containing protein [Ditylenchus destructor]|nr:fibronectin type III domain-containing protein [Ditylenchus destructor]
MSPFSSGQLRLLRRWSISAVAAILFTSLIITELSLANSDNQYYSSINSEISERAVRVRRQTKGTESLLTVEWEGIQSGDHPDSSIRGFIVEYRAEKESQWNVHSGVIPYKGPNHQYRVKIPKLPTGISYFVRIKVLGEKNEVLVETPEIRARNEIVSIKCEADEITAPRDVDVKERGQFSVALSWQPPECGSVGEYHVELRGRNDQLFDVHRQTVAQPSASITGLLSGTEYGVRIRAVDRSRTLGPWNEELVSVSTKGEAPESSNDMSVEYKSENEARIRWKHYDDERLQHYEVILVELDVSGIAQRIDRSRVGPTENSVLFTELTPQTEYNVGVVTYVDHEPKHVYRLTFASSDKSAVTLDVQPIVVKEGEQHFQVHWKRPQGIADVHKFIVEYRPKNDSRWLRANEERMASEDEDSYSVSAPELVDAFSARVIFVDSSKKAVAKTQEVLVSGGEDSSGCNSAGGTVRDITMESTSATLSYSWNQPQCDEKAGGPIVGYEYSIWKKEDGQSPPDTTSYTSKPSVIIEGLTSNTVFLFRARSRLANGHSPWSQNVEGLTVDKENGDNIYRLRIVLAPPKSYLLIYELRNNEWTSHGSPLFFILVEADDSSSSTRPNSLRVTAHDSTSLEIHWLPPSNPAHVEAYEVTAQEVGGTGRVFRDKLAGSTFRHVFTRLNRQSSYNVTVRAISNAWPQGEPASQIFQFPDSGVRDDQGGVGGGFGDAGLALTSVQVEEAGPKMVISWQVSGESNNVRAYQIEQKPERDGQWRPVGNYISNTPNKKQYKEEFDHSALIDSQVQLRVRAIGPRGDALKITQTPSDVSIVRLSADSVVLRWSYPTEPTAACGLYFVISGTIDNTSVQQTVDGRAREHRFDRNPARNWNLKIGAANRLGAGPISAVAPFQADSVRAVNIKIDPVADHHRIRRSICDPRTDFWCRPSTYSTDAGDKTRGALVSTPIVSQNADGTIQVRWRSQGNGRNVFGYRVLFSTPSSGWNPYGQMVPYVGDNEDYSQTLTGLSVGLSYRIQIQALDRNSYVLFTTPEVGAQSQCQAPTHPPTHLAIDAPDSRHVRLTWNAPVQSTWRCSVIQVEIQVDEPRGLPPVTVDGRQNSHVFETQPDQPWAVKVRTVNSAGQSPWSTSVSSKSPPASELIEGPFVTYSQGTPRLSWRSREGSDPDLIDHFVVEYRTRTEPRWNSHGEKIQYSGWQRPYTADMTVLRPGHVYEVHVKAIDHNFGTAFVSPSVTIQSSQQCSPPRSSPRGIEVSPIGPTQIRLSWQPLPETEWNCDRVWYIVKYSSPETQGHKNLTQGETEAVFTSKPYTQWQFEVQAANPAGTSPWSRAESSQTLSTAPGAVADLDALASSADSIQLSWRQPANPNGVVSGYEVTYQLISRVVTVESDRPTYTIGQLHPHSKYRVGVAARTTVAGERTTREVQTDQSVPTAPPANVRVDNAVDSTAELSWHAPPCVHTNGDITEYEYDVSPVGGHGNVPRLLETTRSTRVPLHGLVPNVRYTAKVRAFTSRGAGPWSPDIVFETRAQPVSASQLYDPQARVWQTNQNTAGYYDKFTCRWTPAGQQTYQEKQFPAYSPCDVEVMRRQQLPPNTQFSQTHCGRIDGLRPEPYDFQVKSKPKEGPWSPWSPPQRTTIGEGPVKINSLTKLGSTPTSLHFGWTVLPSDLLRCSSFRITVVPRDRSEHPKVFDVDRNTLNYRVDGLKPNTVYAVTVQANTNNVLNPGMTVDMSTDAERFFGVEQRPRVIDEKATSITIAWDVSPTIRCSSFLVEYRLDNGVWQQDVRRVPCETARQTYTSTVQGLPTNSAVDLRVVAVSLQNQPSPPSPEVRGHTKCSAPEQPPQGLRLDAPSTNEVRVSWARPAKSTWNCDQLNVEIGYRVGDQPEKTLSVSADRTDYVFPSEPNSRWVVRLRSTNQVGVSPWGPEATIATKQGAPGSVRDLQLTPLSPNEIRVRWLPPLTSQGTIVGYDISYRLKHRMACPDEEPRDVSRDFVTIYNHKDLDYTLTGLLPNSLYEVKVRARTTELGPEETKEAATHQQPPSAPPLNLQLTYALERSLSFQWEPVDCSQRHGQIVNYEYEIVGQDDWAKLERQIANTSDTRVTIDGLTPFTKYVMRVKAYNSIGGGPNTENLDVMTAKANAPLPPQDLVVTQEGTDFVIVSWLPPYPPYGPHDSYKLRYQLLNTGNAWQHIEIPVGDRRLECPAVGPRFCFNITGLESGQQYRIQVAAHIEGGTHGPYSSAVIANTLQILPDAPRAIELIAKTDHSLHIRWVPPEDLYGHITQYRLTYTSAAEPGARPETVIVNHPQIDYLIDNLDAETTYNISLSAGTSRGFGPEIWARFTTDPFRVPSVIQAPIVTPEGAHILNVEWTGVIDPKNRVAGYIIELRPGDSPVWAEFGEVVRHEPGKRTYYSKLTSLDPDTLYFVRIKVVDNRKRISDASPEAQGRTGCAAPLSPPTNVNLQSPHWTQVRVSWQPPSKSSWMCSTIRYRVQFTNGTQPTKQVEVPGGATEYVLDSGPNTKWRISVRTENDAGASPYSDELEIKTAGGAPGPVTDLSARPTGPSTGDVTWRAPDESNGEITGYTLVYQLKSIGDCGPAPSSVKPITVHSKEEHVELTDLVPDSVYEIHVIAHTTQPGPKSKTITMRTEEDVPSGQPKNLRTTSVTATRAELLWNEIECELRHGKITGYNYELEALNDWGTNTSQDTATHRVSLDSLIPYTQYRARVRGQNSKGLGPFSEWHHFQTLPAAPSSPIDLSVDLELPHALEISFTPPSPPNGNLDFYRIRHTPRDKFSYKENRVATYELVCSTGARSGRLCYRITNLEPETEYEIQVAAHTERGDWSDWSEPAYGTTQPQNIPVIERPLELDFVKSTSIGVKWRGLDEKDAEHITGYVLEYKSEDDENWQEHNGVVRHRQRQNEYKVAVRNLQESTEYFFRLRVVGKADKRGLPGPELKAVTKCGRPEQPPSNVKIESVDFENVRITWDNPEEDTWKCDEVELVLQYSNSTSQGTLTLPVDGPREVVFGTVPGTR